MRTAILDVSDKDILHDDPTDPRNREVIRAPSSIVQRHLGQPLRPLERDQMSTHTTGHSREFWWPFELRHGTPSPLRGL